jgi:hypothetical protein
VSRVLFVIPNTVFLRHINTGVVRKQNKMSSRSRGGMIYIYRLYNIGVRTKPWATPTASFLGTQNSPFTKTLNFLSASKEAICLMRLVENSNSDNLYHRPECHVVSNAFLISKNKVALAGYNLRSDPTENTAVFAGRRFRLGPDVLWLVPPLACKSGHGYLNWWLWKCVYRDFASQRKFLLIKVFWISANTPHYSLKDWITDLRFVVNLMECLNTMECKSLEEIHCYAGLITAH